MNEVKSYKEPVILVDEANSPIGLTEKASVHTASTPLHRGFSIFLLNTKEQVLLQQRAMSKITWPGVWSNTCCGHPMPGESTQQAALRRLDYELGIKISAQDIIIVFPDYRYKAEREGVIENEFCPVMIAKTNSEPVANPKEVMATKWLLWQDFIADSESFKNFTPWCQEEANLLTKNDKFSDFYKTLS
jgi:isopentenyl-diphosphate delta-isomerase